MSRTFVSASSQFLEAASVPIGSAPLTIACWFNSNTITANQILVSLGKSTDSTNAFALAIFGAVGGDPVRATTTATTAASADSTAGYSANTWQHACAVFSAANARAAFLNGTNKGTNTTSRTPSGVDVTTVGALNGGGSHTIFMSGLIAEVAIWSSALTDTEVALLALGYSPILISPQSLAFYAPLIGLNSPEIELREGRSLTVTGATVGVHTRMFYPGSGKINPFASAGAVTLAAGSNTATFTNPAVSLLKGGLSLSAGVNTALFTSPVASLGVGAVNLNAGSNTVNFTSPTAFLIQGGGGSGQSPKGSKYRWGHVVHWIWKQ